MARGEADSGMVAFNRMAYAYYTCLSGKKSRFFVSYGCVNILSIVCLNRGLTRISQISRILVSLVHSITLVNSYINLAGGYFHQGSPQNDLD